MKLRLSEEKMTLWLFGASISTIEVRSEHSLTPSLSLSVKPMSASDSIMLGGLHYSVRLMCIL